MQMCKLKNKSCACKISKEKKIFRNIQNTGNWYNSVLADGT